ncbi:2-hydroxyglutaryl-CoA dehydratase, D-component [uncultured archaeon]|nr:2-hydroxyglutaryl-CoA dehydratase, D-component [uncultured archaeon]
MSIKKSKIKVAIFPLFGLESLVATFLDKNRFEIARFKLVKDQTIDKYGQELFGDWCYSLKLFVSVFEKLVREQNVKKVVGIKINLCKYPMVMGDLQKWIKKDFEYYQISMDELCVSKETMLDFFKQIKKIDPELKFIEFTKKIPAAIKRLGLGKKLTQTYYKTLPLVKNPASLKRTFDEYKRKFILAEGAQESENIVNEFSKICSKEKIKEKPKYRFLIAGDATTILLGFPFFDLDVFLAKHGAETVLSWPSSIYNFKLSKYSKQAKEKLHKIMSNKNSPAKITDKYIVELITLSEILKGLDQKVDGIIYVKPNMCTPLDNISYVIKKENFFGLPFVELSYDEHSGINGMLTRLEAFINIVSDKKDTSK